MNIKELEEALRNIGDMCCVYTEDLHGSKWEGSSSEKYFNCIEQIAKEYAQILPLLEKMREARKKATAGEWRACYETPTSHGQIAITSAESDLNVAGVPLGLADRDSWDGCILIQKENKESVAISDFITTAANNISAIDKLFGGE